MKTLLQVLFLLIAGTLHAGCTALVVGGAPAGSQDSPTRSSMESSRDAAITTSINSRYVHDSAVDALAIRVTTYRGVVTLQGSVKSESAAARAVDLARTTPNVRRVVSRLTITP